MQGATPKKKKRMKMMKRLRKINEELNAAKEMAEESTRLVSEQKQHDFCGHAQN